MLFCPGMSNKLALISMLGGVLASAACVTEAGDPLGLDGLPPYNGDGGAGKGDDPNCTDAAYRDFIKPYMATVAGLGAPLTGDALAQVKAAAAENPCKSGNDASYIIWAYVASGQLAPTFDAYNAAIEKRSDDRNFPPVQVDQAGTLTDAQRAMLQALALVRPQHAGVHGFAWWGTLVAPAFKVASRSVGTLAVLAKPEQLAFQITPYEEEWLAFVESSEPTPVEPTFAAWESFVDPLLHQLEADVSPNAAQAEVEHAFMTRLATTRPDTTFDADGQAFQTAFTSQFVFDYRNPYLTYDQEMVALKPPRAGGILSYKAWATVFVDAAQRFNGSTPSADQKGTMAALVAARPCGSGPEVDALGMRLHDALVAAGDDGAGRALADDAMIDACAP